MHLILTCGIEVRIVDIQVETGNVSVVIINKVNSIRLNGNQKYYNSRMFYCLNPSRRVYACGVNLAIYPSGYYCFAKCPPFVVHHRIRHIDSLQFLGREEIIVIWFKVALKFPAYPLIHLKSHPWLGIFYQSYIRRIFL